MGCGEGEGCIGPEQKYANERMRFWELLTYCAEKYWDLDVIHAKAHPHKEGQEGHDQGTNIRY